MAREEKDIDNTATNHQDNISKEDEEITKARNEEVENLKKDISKLKEEIKELNNTILRQYADNENLRKRFQREIEDANKYAMAEFAKDLLEVFENIYRAKSHVNIKQEGNEQIKNMFDGLEMTTKLLEEMCKKHEMLRIYPQGEAFDHDCHQAISHLIQKETKPGTVIEVAQAGYKLKDRLLRPALVVVAKE